LRLKEDIRRIGSTVHDLPIYSFRYRGQEGAYEGVMAQDVLPVRPDAVVMGADGFYRVDYDKLGIAMRRLDSPNLLDLAKNESGSNISKLSKSFGPNPPDDSDESDLRLKEDKASIASITANSALRCAASIVQTCSTSRRTKAAARFPV
jgi:hypothetical protein